MCFLGCVTCQLNSTQRYHKTSLSPHEVNKLQCFWLLRGSSVLAGLTLHHAGLKSDTDKPRAVRGPTCIHGPGSGWVPQPRGAGLREAGAGGLLTRLALRQHRSSGTQDRALPSRVWVSQLFHGGGGRVTAKPPAPAAPRVTRQVADGIRIPGGLTGGSVTASAERACLWGALRWPPRPSTLHAGSGLLARGADFRRGPAAHASRPGVSFRSRAVWTPWPRILGASEATANPAFTRQAPRAGRGGALHARALHTPGAAGAHTLGPGAPKPQAASRLSGGSWLQSLTPSSLTNAAHCPLGRGAEPGRKATAGVNPPRRGLQGPTSR